MAVRAPHPFKGWVFTLRHPEWGWLRRPFVPGDGRPNWTFDGDKAWRFADAIEAGMANVWDDRVAIHRLGEPPTGWTENEA